CAREVAFYSRGWPFW
nr:immunoglobulin heavy chain junction region [Macaca mulatta]MOV50111.1 immunoglobulin heavy chain junction region [Macaca mulatta]